MAEDRFIYVAAGIGKCTRSAINLNQRDGYKNKEYGPERFVSPQAEEILYCFFIVR